MSNFSGIPRPFGILDAKRAREEESRLREQATSARNTSNTTVGSGGRLDVDGGDLTVKNGGNASVKDGGRFLVEGGGSMEITDDGVVKVVGSTLDPIAGVTVAEAAFQTEEVYHPSAGVTTRSPGLFFKTESATGGAIRSSWGDDVSVDSGMRLVDFGPLVGPDVYKSASARANPGNAGLYAAAFFSTTPDMTDSRSQCYIEAYPDAIVAELGSVALGRMGGINVSIADPKLRLYGRDGVDVKGPFTVDGAPVGGAVDSVAGKTGAVTLVKADVGLGNVDNTSDAAKPVSTATQAALDGKASTAVATTTAAGLMPSTDKTKLDNATPSPTANRLIYRDTFGRAQIADPAVAADIATKGYVDSTVSAVGPGSWVTVPASAGWQPQAVDPPKVKIINGVVYATGKFQYIGAATSVGGYYATSQLVGQMPAGYYPPSEVQTQAIALWHASGASTACRITIGTTGEIRMYAQAVNGVTTNFQIGSATYVYMSSVSAYPLP